MVESQLKSGPNIFVVRVEHFVKLVDFSKALADHYYNKSVEFDTALTKKEAEKILRNSLFFHGLYGPVDEESLEGSFEEGEVYSGLRSKAADWVKKNYPYLSKNDNL